MKKSKRFLSLALTMVCVFGFLGACKQEEEHAHNYKSYVYKEATCKYAGVMEKLCFECGDKKYEEIPKSEIHNYEWTTVKQATCKEEGLKKGVCEDCQIETTETISSEEGHQYTWQVIEEATCFKEGKSKGVCDKCGETTNKALSKISHEYANGVCTMCFNKNIVAVLSKGETLGYTYADIQAKSERMGLWFDLGYINVTNEYELRIKLEEKNGTLQFAYNDWLFGYLSFGIGEVFSDFIVEQESDKIIDSLIIRSVEVVPLLCVPQLCIAYKDGSIIPAGYIHMGDSTSDYMEYNIIDPNNVIKSIAINKQNKLLLVSENNCVDLMGIISESENNILPDIFYLQTGETFSCVGFLSQKNQQTELVIAPSHMGKTVDSIGVSAFSRNKYLKKVILSDEIKTINRRAFAECIALKQVELGKNIEKIGAGAFYMCEIEKINIPATCVEIGAYAFESCSKLTKINYQGSVKQWEEMTLGRGWNFNVPATEVICSNGRVTIN